MPDTLRLAGALVPPHEHAGLGLAIRESGVEAIDVASVLDFGSGFDVTEGPAGEANVALDLTEAVWTFAQGGFRFRDGSGPLLSTGASGDDLFLTGDLDVSGVVAVGNHASATINPAKALHIRHYTGNVDVVDNRGAAVHGQLYLNSATTGFSYGFMGELENLSSVQQYVAGLFFNLLQNGSGTLGLMRGVDVNLITYSGKGAVASADGVRVTLGFEGPKPSTFRGFYLATSGVTGMGLAYGLHVEDMVGTTVRLLEIGPATPYLRLVGGGNPAANQTNLYLAEGVTPTLRRVQWKDAGAGGANLSAGDRVMVLA